jgi:hypothetical protein
VESGDQGFYMLRTERTSRQVNFVKILVMWCEKDRHCFGKHGHRQEDSIAVYLERSRGSSVNTVSDYGPDGRGSIPDKGRGFFL